jgi:pectate lyase-like protein
MIDSEVSMRRTLSGFVVAATLFLGAKPAAAVSLTAFGAKCDGVTDDTAAIQQAITSLVNRGGTLSIPRSNTSCIFSSTIFMISNLHLVGEGNQGDGSVLIAPSPSTLKYTGTGPAIQCGGGAAVNTVQQTVFEDFTLEGNSTATSGIFFGGSSANFCVRSNVHRVTIRSFLGTGAAGLLIRAGVTILVDQSYISRNYDGVVVNGNAGTTTLHFRDVPVRTNLHYGYYLQDEIQNITIDGSASVIESNGSCGIRGEFSTGNAVGLTIRDVYIGNSNWGAAPEDAQVLLTMTGGYLQGAVIDHVYFADAGSSGDISIQAVSADIRNVFGAARPSHAIVRVLPGSDDVRCHQILTWTGGWVHSACTQY